MINIVIQIALIIIGFFMLIKGAEYFVDGASGIAKKIGVSQLIIGLTIVAMGTSIPEAAVSITAAFKGTDAIAVGNIVGSNILNILIILGISACVRCLKVQMSTFRYEIPFMTIITIVFVVCGAMDGIVSFVDGVILWVLFIIYWIYLLHLAKKEKNTGEPCNEKLWKVITMVIVGAVVIVLGSNVTVNAATALAKDIGISERFIGLTIVALGTSLPELVTSVVAAKKGNNDIAIGNIVGSNIFNILFVIGTSSIILPLKYQSGFIVDGIVAVGVSILLFVAVAKKKILNKTWGIIMLFTYAIYFVYLLMK